MQTCNRTGIGAFAALMMLVPLVPLAAADDDATPFTSATEAYRQGMKAIKSDQPAVALPAFEYAAARGVLGAQLKLARLYAAGDTIAKNDGKAFSYYRQIADQQADIFPRSPIAKYVAEAFVALGQYHLEGIPAVSLSPNPRRAAGLFRHAASYFGDAEAQYRLARLYLSGEGVNQNTALAANWLVAAAKKQHAASQATLGELLWRGEGLRQRPARGLALITLAHANAKANAKASGKEPQWIEQLYGEVIRTSDAATRKRAQAMLPQLGGARVVIVEEVVPTQLSSESGAKLVVPASDAGAKAASPTPAAEPAADSSPPAQESALPSASLGVSLGFSGGEGGLTD